MDIVSFYKDAYISHFKKQGYSTFEATKMAEKLLKNLKTAQKF